MNLNEGEKNAFTAIRTLIKKAEIKLTDQSLKIALWNHTDFPSFAAFSDVLNDFKIDNIGTRITIQQLKDIPLPALVHFDNDRGGFFGTITKVEDEIVNFEVDGKNISEHYSLFSRHWGGVTLLIQPTDQSGEPNFKSKRFWEVINNFRLAFISICLLFMIVWLFQSKYIFDVSFALLLLKITGIFISSLLIWQSLDTNNSFLLNICQLNEKTNCNSILQSKGAKLFGIISWAEIGLFYFGGGILSLILNKTPSQFLIYFNFLALPYVIYSVYYQAFVVRKWCMLCLIIQLIFVLEFFNSIYLSPLISDIKTEILSFSLLPLLWWLIKPMFQKGHYFENVNRELQKIIFSSDYLQALAFNSNPLPEFFEGMKPILIGNLEAKHTLTVVANPTCSACSFHVTELFDTLKYNTDFNARIILASGTNKNIVADKVALELFSLQDELIAEKVLDWFKAPNINRWENNNEIDISQEAYEQLNLAQRWLVMSNINTAPALFLDNIRLPRVYGIKAISKLCHLLQPNEDLIRSTK